METNNSILQVPVEDIIPNRFQPRLAFDSSALKELSDSIKVHGIIQPLVLRRIGDKYEIIAGERRYKAATMAGLTSVPAIISNLDDKKSAEVAVVENVQRKDLTAIEEAKSYKALLDMGYMSQDELAKRMGLSQSAVSNKLRLLALDEEVQEAILNEKISERHARSLLKVKEKEKQKELLNRIITERLTVKKLEDEIKKLESNEGDEMPSVNEEKNNESNDILQFMDIKPKNKFFNLEEEKVNMSFEEPEEIELLDFDVESNKNDELISKIKDLLKNYPNVSFEENKDLNSININIKIPQNS